MTAEQNRPLKAIKTSQRVVLPDGSEGVVTGVALGSDGEPLVRVRAVKATDALLNWFRDVSANGRARGIQFSSSEPDNMIRAAEREGWIERRPNYPSGVTNPQYDITAKGRNALKQQPARSASKSGDVTVLAARSVKARPYDDAWGRQITEVIDRKLGYDFVWDNSDGTFTVGYRYMNPGDGGLQEAQRQQDAMVRKVQQVFPGARVRYEKVLMPRLGDARYYTIQVRFAPRRQAGKAAKADNGEGALENLERKIQSSRDSTPEQAKKVIAQLFAEYRRIVAAHEDITDNTAHKQLYNLLANPPSMLGVSASRYWNTVEQAIGNLISQLAQSRSRDYGKAAKADDSQLVAQQVAALTSLLREIARAGVTLRDAKPRQMATLYKGWRAKWNQAVTPRSSLRDHPSWIHAAAAFEALSGAGTLPNMDTEQHRRIVAGVVDKLGQLVADTKRTLAGGKSVKAAKGWTENATVEDAAQQMDTLWRGWMQSFRVFTRDPEKGARRAALHWVEVLTRNFTYDRVPAAQRVFKLLNAAADQSTEAAAVPYIGRALVELRNITRELKAGRGFKSVKAVDPKSLYLDLRQIVIKAEAAIKPAVAKQLANQLEALRPRIASFNQEYETSINADAAQKLLQALINPREYQRTNQLSDDQLLRNVVNLAVKLKNAVGQMAYEVNDARLKGGKSASAKTPSTRVGSVVVKNELGFMPHPDTSGDWFFNIDGVENRIYGRYAEALRKAVMIAKRDLLTEITVTGVRRDYGQ